MSNKMKKLKISITIDPYLNEELAKYMATQPFKGTRSYYIEEALRNYLSTDKDKLTQKIKQEIDDVLKQYGERLARILAKIGKSTYANQYLALLMYAYMCNSEDDKLFLLNSREEAEKQGYKALTDKQIVRDVDSLFPNDELLKKADKDV